MITDGTLESIARQAAARHAPAWAELREATAAAKAARWPDGALLAVVGRAEALAAAQADTALATVRPLLARLATTPQARRTVDDQLSAMRAGLVGKLLPGGLTVAAVEAKLAEADAADNEIENLFLEALR